LYFPGGNAPFTTGPVVTLASLVNPAIEWFGQRPWLRPAGETARIFRRAIGRSRLAVPEQMSLPRESNT
jgi:hypothetical protein